MVESIYFLKPAWCGTPCAGLWPEQGLQPVRKAFAFRRWFFTLNALGVILNALGVIDQSIPAREIVERGAPPRLVPAMMWAGRAVELVAGLALIWGAFPRLAALALFAFL